MERSSYRNEPRPDRNTLLREDLVELARQKPRYGYRRLLHALLSRRGHEVNAKRVYRLYVEEGLTVRRRKHLVRERAIEPRFEQNEPGVGDGLHRGWAGVHILSVVDAYTRQCLALEAGTGLGSGRRDASTGTTDRRAWKTGVAALGQRGPSSPHDAAGLGRRVEDRAGPPAGPSHAERP